MTNIQAINLLKDLEQSLDDYCELNDEGKTAFRMAITALEVFGNSEQLPPAQPEPQWIPCSERLPDDDTLMLVNYVDHRPDAMDIWIGWHEMENVWYIDGEAHSEEFGNEVVAWMPLPEPYAERRQE